MREVEREIRTAEFERDSFAYEMGRKVARAFGLGAVAGRVRN